jgi:hypothetical protein
MSVQYVLNCTFRIGLRVSDRVVLLDECRTESHRTKSQSKGHGHYKNIIIVQVQQQWHQGMRCTFTIRTTVAPGYALYIYNKDNSDTRVCVVHLQ